MEVPAIVTRAIRTYTPPPGYELVRAKPGSKSIIFKWGVRVVASDGSQDSSAVRRAEEDERDATAAQDTEAAQNNEIGGSDAREARFTSAAPRSEDDSDSDGSASPPTAAAETRPRQQPAASSTTALRWSWICLADATCRELDKPRVLCGNKTSKTTKHLSEAHGIIADKTQLETENKRKCEADAEHLKQSELFKQDPARLKLLLETMRIVAQDLPFNFGEAAGSRLIEDVFAPPEAKAAINSKNVKHSILELYASTKVEIVSLLAKSKDLASNAFTLVTDFWSCPMTKSKYLGARVYFITHDWKYRSVLLGVREFDPLFEQRVAGIRQPFKQWLQLMLTDFRLKVQDDFFASTSDSGSDVKGLMEDELRLRWRWCMAHLTNAATKMACGIVGDKNKSRNPEMTELIANISKTVCDVKSVQVVGSLFKFLAKSLVDDDTPMDSKTAKLLDFKSHRFMGLTNVIRRLLMEWTAIVKWYDKHRELAEKKRKEVKYVFLLANHREDLIQLLSLFEPLTAINFKSQCEAPNQVEVLLLLFRARETVLNLSAPIIDYRHTKEKPRSILPTALTPMVQKTRKLLRDEFHTRFFSRYTDPGKIARGQFLFEMSLHLHPRYKHFNSKLGPIVRLCNAQLGVTTPNAVAHDVENAIRDRVKAALELLGPPDISPPAGTQTFQEFSGDLESYEEDLSTLKTPKQRHTEIIDEELRRWRSDTTTLEESSPGSQRAESVLGYWERHASRYQLLSKLVRMVYAIPASSGQIERDFGQCGNTVTDEQISTWLRS